MAKYVGEGVLCATRTRSFKRSSPLHFSPSFLPLSLSLPPPSSPSSSLLLPGLWLVASYLCHWRASHGQETEGKGLGGARPQHWGALKRICSGEREEGKEGDREGGGGGVGRRREGGKGRRRRGSRWKRRRRREPELEPAACGPGAPAGRKSWVGGSREQGQVREVRN